MAEKQPQRLQLERGDAGAAPERLSLQPGLSLGLSRALLQQHSREEDPQTEVEVEHRTRPGRSSCSGGCLGPARERGGNRTANVSRGAILRVESLCFERAGFVKTVDYEYLMKAL